jgi:hypothetical protein
MKQYSLAIILFIYSFLTLATLFSWHTKQINTVTGDEPHYLVMASGIAKHGSLEQTAPYMEEFKSREIFKSGLAPKDQQPSPENTHAVLGPHGLFNIHNIGLPLLLVLPFMLSGIIGAKLFMVFCGALVVTAAWKISSCFSENVIHKFLAVTATAISVPLLPASNQIFPDVLAGLIALIGLYWFLTAHHKRHSGLELLLAIIIAYLPWLQIKFSATCVVLVLAISAKIYIDSKDLRRVLPLLIIAGASCIALVLYNNYAFGKFSGPYQSGALEISRTSLMVFLGLYIDQNQGFLILNPVNLIGVLAIGWFYQFNRPFFLIWGLVFLSLIVPNALHPNWYGGWSFSGRFGCAATAVFFIPVIYGLLEIGKRKEIIFRSIVAVGMLLQLYLFYQYAFGGVSLYNRAAATWFDAYSIFYFPVRAWLPMLYNASWAYGYAPNYAWLIIVCALPLIGFLRKGSYLRLPVLALLIAPVFASGFVKNEQANVLAFDAAQLPSQTGKVLDLTRFAEQNLDTPGFINFGPYFPLRKGGYEITLTYSSSGEVLNAIGWFDIFNATSQVQVIQIPLHGTENASQELKVKFETVQREPNLFEFRTNWYGTSNIVVKKIVLKKY